MSRFRLVPLEQKSAQEQLWTAARQATLHVLKTHRFYGLQGYSRDGLIEDVILEGVRNFMEFKIGHHTYNRNFPFFNNVMSSVWSVQNTVATKHIKLLERQCHSQDIDDVAFLLTEHDRFPLYMSKWECESKRGKSDKPYSKLCRPADRAARVRDMYEDYVAEARDMGLQNIMELGRWIHRNGYAGDHDMMLYLEEPEVRKSMVREHAQIMRDRAIPENELKNRLYMREWSRRHHEKKLAEMAREYNALYGPPPEGYRWILRGQTVGLQKIGKKRT